MLQELQSQLPQTSATTRLNPNVTHSTSLAPQEPNSTLLETQRHRQPPPSQLESAITESRSQPQQTHRTSSPTSTASARTPTPTHSTPPPAPPAQGSRRLPATTQPQTPTPPSAPPTPLAAPTTNPSATAIRALTALHPPSTTAATPARSATTGLARKTAGIPASMKSGGILRPGLVSSIATSTGPSSTATATATAAVGVGIAEAAAAAAGTPAITMDIRASLGRRERCPSLGATGARRGIREAGAGGCSCRARGRLSKLRRAVEG